MYELSLDAAPMPDLPTSLRCKSCVDGNGDAKVLRAMVGVSKDGEPVIWYWCRSCGANWCPGPNGNGTFVEHERAPVAYVDGKTKNGRKVLYLCMHPDCLGVRKGLAALLKQWATDPLSKTSRTKLAALRAFEALSELPPHSLTKVRIRHLAAVHEVLAEARRAELAAMAEAEARRAAERATRVMASPGMSVEDMLSSDEFGGDL